MPATPRTLEFTQAHLEEAARLSRAWGKEDARYELFRPRIGEGDDMTADRYDINVLRYQAPAQWMIDGIVEENGLTIFFGPDKVGKTAMLSNFLWSWTAGKDWFLDPDFQMRDHSENGRKVVYVLLEGAANYYSRYQAWCDVYNDGEPIEGFDVVTDGLALFQPGMKAEDPSTWTRSALGLYNALVEDPPAILVIDTLSRATGGMNENSSEMAQVVSWADRIRDKMGIATIIVHHVSLDKSESARPRGHSSLKGAASSYVRISGDPDDNVLYLKHGPHRNAESGSHGYGFVRRNHMDAFVVDRTMKTNQTIEISDRTKELLDILRSRGGEEDVHYLAERMYGENVPQTRKYLSRLCKSGGAASDYVEWIDGDFETHPQVRVVSDPAIEPEVL